MNAEPRSCIILGSGGHARSVLSLLNELKWKVSGYVSPDVSIEDWPDNCPWLGDDTTLDSIDPNRFVLINGVGSISSTALRRRIYLDARAQGFDFPAVVHPSAIINNVKLDDGVQVMAGAIIQAGTTIKENTLINTASVVEHDSYIDAHVHIAPSVTICGGVQVGHSVHVGCGAIIIQGVKIGTQAIVGAGAVVLRSVEQKQTVVGNPARPLAFKQKPNSHPDIKG